MKRCTVNMSYRNKPWHKTTLKINIWFRENWGSCRSASVTRFPAAIEVIFGPCRVLEFLVITATDPIQYTLMLIYLMLKVWHFSIVSENKKIDNKVRQPLEIDLLAKSILLQKCICLNFCSETKCSWRVLIHSCCKPNKPLHKIKKPLRTIALHF